MSAQAGNTSNENQGIASKGKGKAKDNVGDVEMGDDDSSDEESGVEEQVEEEEEEDEDNMEEIDTDNIVEGGRRTRGKVIDFAKAAEQDKGTEEDEEEDDDEDYEAPDEEMEG